MIDILAAALFSNRRPAKPENHKLKKNDLLKLLTGFALLAALVGGLSLASINTRTDVETVMRDR